MPLKQNDPKIWVFDCQTPEGIVSLVVRQIDSGNIEWIGWPEKGGEPLMFVQFIGGSRYIYSGVTRQRAVACAYAESSGTYLNKRIKGKYEVIKIR